VGAYPPPARRRAVSEDLAAHHEVVDPGPVPAVRAAVGVLLGAAVGAFALVLTARRHEA
jgi:hypothetical protein